MALYLVDKGNGEVAKRVIGMDGESKVVFIKDGAYLDVSTFSGKLYAMEDDVEIRGLKERLAGKVELIDYPRLADLIVDNKVINFA